MTDYLSISGGKIDGFVAFSNTLVLSETQTTSSRIQIQVVNFTYFSNDCYIDTHRNTYTCTDIYIYTHMPTRIHMHCHINTYVRIYVFNKKCPCWFPVFVLFDCSSSHLFCHSFSMQHNVILYNINIINICLKFLASFFLSCLAVNNEDLI